MTKKTNGEGSIMTTIRNGKKYYVGRITLGFDSQGNQIRKSFSSFKKTTVINKMIAAKRLTKTNNISNSDIKFSDLFLLWANDYKKIKVSTNTYREYISTHRLRIAPYAILNKKANSITLDDLQKYFVLLQTKYTPTTIKNTYKLIKACFTFAIIQGIVNKNYCSGVVLQQVKKTKKISAFSLDEQRRILEALDLNRITDCVIYFTFFTGLRLGEVLGLEWSDVHNNILKITKQYARIRYEKGTGYEMRDLKTTGSAREIPLPKKAVALLETLPKDSNLIFHTNNIGIEHKRPQRRMIVLCKSLDIPYKSFHCIRHSYATRLFELNVPIKTVQVLLGHSEISTTMDIYTHVMESKKLEALELLNSL